MQIAAAKSFVCQFFDLSTVPQCMAISAIVWRSGREGTMTQDFNLTNDQANAATPGYSYIEDDERLIIHAGVLIGSGTDAVASNFLLSQLVNSGDINSGAGSGVRFSKTGASILNN